MFSSSSPHTRSAAFILSIFGAVTNFYISLRLASLWVSFRWSWEGESEWESYALTLDAARALGVIVASYFFVGGIACTVGLIGVIKRHPSYVRLFRDYSIADLVFGFASTIVFTVGATQPTIRARMCEELSRQPDLLRTLSDTAGLNVENCESFFDKAVVGFVLALFVVLFVRLQFTLTVLNYYTYLRRTTHHYHHVSRRSTHSGSSSHQRVLLLSSQLPSSPSRTPIYAPVELSSDMARSMDAREAYLSVPDCNKKCLSPSSTTSGVSTPRGNAGPINLRIIPGEGLSSRHVSEKA